MVTAKPVTSYTKPKRKTLKIVILSILIIILGIGVWVGVVAYKTMKKITSFSPGGSIFSLFDDANRTKLQGENDGRTNILLLGMGGKNHPGGTLSDTMIVLSLNWKDKKVAMLSIPRDLWVPIPDYGSAKINEAYAYGEQNPKTTGGGGKLASETVSQILDIPIHYFVTVDFEGFKKLVDTVGGVDVTVEKDIYDPYYPAANMIDYDPFRISAGDHHMDGELALKYVRSRKTTSDFDRSARQAQVIKEVKEKTLSLNILANPAKITELMNILGDHLRTNMTINEIKALYDDLRDFDTENLINKVLDTAADGPLTASSDSRGYYIYPKKGINNFSDLQVIAKNIFSEASAQDIQIEVLNGSGKSGMAKEASDTLEEAGFQVTKIGDATKTYSNSVVYNCSKVDSKIVEEIAKELNATSETKTDCGTIDIQVIIGQSSNLRS